MKKLEASTKKYFIFGLILLSLGAFAFQQSPYARRIYPVTADPTCTENQIWYNSTTHLAKICTNLGAQTIALGGGGGAGVLLSPVTIGVGQTTSATTDLLINPTTKASGNLFDAQVNSVSKFKVDFAGVGTFASNLAVAGNITSTASGGGIQAGTTGFISWASSKAIMSSPADGNILLQDSAAATFGRLQLGGTTSSFPALKRNLTAINFRLADDSADAPITAAGATFSGNVLINGAGSGTKFQIIDTGGTNPALTVDSSAVATIFANSTARVTSGGFFDTLDAGVFRWQTTLGSAQNTTLSRESNGVIRAGTNAANSSGSFKALTYLTDTNCSDSAGAAACGSASAGSFVIDAATTSTVVSTTSVTANSQIFIQNDSSLGTRLSVTCNTQSSLTLGTPRVTARTAGTSFTVTIEVGPTTNPMCLNYRIVN